MSTPPGWRRVRKGDPCPVCEHTDWCMVRDDGALACCCRVESDQPWGNTGGYIHELRPERDRGQARQTIRRSLRVGDPPQAPPLWAPTLAAATERAAPALPALAASLGVSEESLKLLGTGLDHSGVLLFPMRSERGLTIGVRVRSPNGAKWSIKGSRSGMFYCPALRCGSEYVYVAEGPTDTASLITLGLDAVGRPDAASCEGMLVSLLRNYGKPVVIVSDNDGVGLRGAKSLATKVGARIVVPRGKDIREWVRNGATREMVEAIAKNTEPWKEDHVTCR